MKVAFLFLPPWDSKYPSYAMALFKASTKESGHNFIGFDLNVDLYNAAQDDDKKLWDAQHANLWDVDRNDIIQKYAGYLDAYIEEMIKNQIDLYAISILGYSKYLAFYIAQKIKDLIPKAAILLGGPECFPAYDGLNILKNRYVDAICTGEGDAIWPRVLQHFDKNKNLHIDIPGISYENDDGTIIDNGTPELVKDLNSVPFADYSDIDFGKYGNKYQFSIMTSRGCINTCAFCSERPNFSKYRFRSAENIFNEISKQLSDLKTNSSINYKKIAISYWRNIFTQTVKHWYHKYSLFRKTAKYFFYKYKRSSSENIFGKVLKQTGDLLKTNHISFNDSLINGTPKELEKFCDLVIDSGLNFSWGGMALIRKEMTYDLLAKMKKAGCRNLAWGMESGCQEVLDLMHKRFVNMDLAKEVIKSAHKAEIYQSISLIVGFPGETEEMLLKTKEFLAEFKDYFTAVSVQPMMIVKNSLVYEKPEDFGVECVDDSLRWQTADGINNYDTRLKRVELIKSVLDGNVITIDK
jgi:radical SAM superfamily enzyme YgiQ (UPF0313 family)